MQESQIIVQINALFCCWFLFAQLSLNLFLIFKLIYIYILKIEKKTGIISKYVQQGKKMCNIILFMCLIFEIFLLVLKKAYIGTFEV